MKKVFKLTLVCIIAVLVIATFAACAVEPAATTDIRFFVDGVLYEEVGAVGGTLSLPANPTKEGYTFDGWYFDNNVWQNPLTQANFSEAIADGTLLIYAKFTKIPDGNGGGTTPPDDTVCSTHTPDADCVCSTCGTAVHSLDEDCVCSVCGVTLHDLDADCVCIGCGEVLHDIDENCVCVECEEIFHVLDEDCVCSVCDAVAHNLDADCECTVCREVLHDLDEDCECTRCEVVLHTPDEDCLCTVCGGKAHDLDEDCECTVCGTVVHSLDEDCLCTVCGTVTHAPNELCLCTRCGEKDHTSALLQHGYCRHGNDIYFGTYPQSEVTNEALKSALGSKDATWSSYPYYAEDEIVEYMYYKDKEYNGHKYRGVYFKSYRPQYANSVLYIGNSQQDENGYFISTTYWFKYEPIKWKVLNDNGDGTALILSELAIDCQYYQTSYSDVYDGGFREPQGEFANNYANSTVRAWLNDVFYNTAFNSIQKNLIELTEIDNSAASTGSVPNNFACANTTDYIFLPSYVEVTAYTAMDSNGERQKHATDYAKSQGTSTATVGGTQWLLRSPDNGEGVIQPGVFIHTVMPDGAIDEWQRVKYTGGICPALTIRLE